MFLKCYFYRTFEDDHLKNICCLADVNSSDLNISNINYCKEYTYQDCYIFDIQFFIFDNLSKEGNMYIKSIFEELSTRSLNYNNWYNYVLYHIKSKIIGDMAQKKYYSIKNIKNKSHNFLLTNFIDNIDEQLKVIEFANNENFFQLFDQNCQEWYEYSTIVATERTLIDNFFNIIFTNKNNLCVRYCENCDRFYITSNNSKKIYCDRHYDNGSTCHEYQKSLNDDRIKKLEKRIRDIIRSNPSLCANFTEYRKNLKMRCKNNINIYVKTLIEDFYMTNIGKKRVIGDLNLYNFFDKDYLDVLSS